MSRLIHNRYAVVRQLGEGSSAVTYLCEDREEGGRLVALKELRPEGLTSWKQFELFEREVRVLRSLRHHGIPEVFDAFETEDDEGRARLCLVTEYVAGVPLKARIEQGPRLGLAELVQVTLGLLDILDYLHSRTPPIIHRDIKPSNIILRPTGAPVLIDFGGVRDGWRAPDQGGSTVVATHGYTPPEQYMGQVTGASDYYALGATLLHVVGGEPPYTYSFDSGQIELPEGLPTSDAMRTLIERALNPAPRERLQSAQEARLLLLAPAEPETSPPPPPTPPTPTAPTPPAPLPALAGPNAARVLDLGAAPRALDGPHRAIWEQMKRAHPVHLFILISVVSIGIALPFLLVEQWRHYNRMKPLFERGTFVRGRLLNNQGMQNGMTFVYEFEVGDKRYRGVQNMLHQHNMTTMSPGDAVGILYDPNDPSQSAIVFDHDRQRPLLPPLSTPSTSAAAPVSAEVEAEEVVEVGAPS